MCTLREFKAYIPVRRKIFALGMLVSKNAKICVFPDTKPKIYVTPNAKPQRQSVEYRLRWVPNTKCSRWSCTFLFFLC